MEERTELKKPLAVVNSGVGKPLQAQGNVHPPAPPAPAAAVFKSVTTPPVVPTRVDTSSARRNDFNFTDDVWSGPPQAAGFSMPNDPAPQPKPPLSDMLSKRSRLPHEDPELFGADTRPNPAQQRNPFQTASERLQVRVSFTTWE